MIKNRKSTPAESVRNNKRRNQNSTDDSHRKPNYTNILKAKANLCVVSAETPSQKIQNKEEYFSCSGNITGLWNVPMIKVLRTDRHKRNLDQRVWDTQCYYDTDREKIASKKRRERGKGERGAHTRFEKRPRYWTNEKWPDVMRKQERKMPTAGGHRSS